MEGIYSAIDKLRQEMRQVQERTQAVDLRRGVCWGKPEEASPTPILGKRATVMTLDDHAAAARELGQAQRAVLRFLRIVSARRHVSVRILYMALAVEHRIHAIRCTMDDLQFMTLRGDERNVTCWLGRLNHFDGDTVNACYNDSRRVPRNDSEEVAGGIGADRRRLPVKANWVLPGPDFLRR